MKCVVCKQGETKDGFTSVTLERDSATLVFKRVPARICANCGEAYVEGKISSLLFTKAESALKEGIQIDVREFKAA